MNNFRPTEKDILGTIEMLRASNCLPRWSANLQHGYTEVAKQALNCQISSILFEFVAHEGNKVNCSLLPQIAISRAFEKYEKCDISEETYLELFSDEPKLEKNFIDYLNNKIQEMTSVDFFSHITGLEDTFEMKIYKAGTAIATYIEALEIKQLIPKNQHEKIMERQIKRLNKYKNFPIVCDILSGSPNKTFDIFKEFSRLRNRIRWVKLAPLRNYSVLGHSYDVAIFNYLFSLYDNPKDIKRAENGFYVGLFHDLAENWTGDMPSPTKNAVPGLREKTEEIERKVLKEHIFPYLPNWLIPKFESMMLEMIPNKELRTFYKIGDDFAATIEAATQLMIGSNDRYFTNVVINSLINKYPLDVCNKVLKHIRKDAKISYIDIILYKLKNKSVNAKIKDF